MLANGDEDYDDSTAGWPATLTALAGFVVIILGIFGLSFVMPQRVLDLLGVAFVVVLVEFVTRSS